MDRERSIRPFPEIAHYPPYEGESNPNLPTPRNTVLFSPLERIALNNQAVLAQVEEGKFAIPDVEVSQTTIEGFQLLSNWVIARNSDQRRRARESMKHFSQGEFPTTYNILGRIIGTQQKIPLVQSRANFAQLSGEIGTVCEVPRDLHIEFYFCAHEIADLSEFEKFKDQLSVKASQTLKREERNVVFLENVEGSKNLTRVRYIEGFRKYKSFYKAQLYEAVYDYCMEMYGAPPDEDTINYVQANMDTTNLRTGEAGFQTAVNEVLDQFLDEGYDIDVEVERSFKDSHNAEELEAISRNAKSPEQGREMLAILARDFRTRNIVVAQQITGIANEAVKKGTKTNLLVIFGSLHYEILDLLPDVLKPVASRNEEAANDFMEALYHVLEETGGDTPHKE